VNVNVNVIDFRTYANGLKAQRLILPLEIHTWSENVYKMS